MATNYNITMKRYNGTDYDVLYPRTLPSQIDGGVYTKDEATGLFLSKTGGQMSGLLDMNGNKISNLAAPTAANDAATKDYVDNNSYMWNKVLLHEWTAVDVAGDMPINNIENLIGFYIDASFTYNYTGGAPDLIGLYLTQVANTSLTGSSSVTWASIPLSLLGTSKTDNSKFYLFFYNKNFGVPLYAGSSVGGFDDCEYITFIAGSGNPQNIYYKSNSTILPQFKMSRSSTKGTFSNISVKLYGLYEK